MWLYLLKVNIALTVFYVIYRCFYRNDTFFELRRGVLLSMLVMAFSYPLVDLTRWLYTHQTLSLVTTAYTSLLPDVEVSVRSTPASAPIDWLYWAGVGYLWVVGLLLLRVVIHAVQLFWLIYRSPSAQLLGTRVKLLSTTETPYSFFGWIFVNPSMHTPDELHEILNHELAHSTHWHSLDTVVSQLFTALCWLNPFSWMYAMEMRKNLEFMADRAVVKAGIVPKSYQYHLVRLAHRPSSMIICNPINVSPLKERIVMMNRKQSRKIKLAAYTLLLPVAFVFLLANSATAISRAPELMGGALKTNSTAATTADVVFKQLEEVVVMGYAIKGATPDAEAEKRINRFLRTQGSEGDFPPELSAQYPGGETEMYRFFARNIKYPAIALENGIQGVVEVEFIVTPSGEITQVKVLQGTDPSLDMEVQKLIQKMPRWDAAKDKANALNARCVMPVIFRFDYTRLVPTKIKSK